MATKKSSKKTTKKKAKHLPPHGGIDVATDLLHDPDFADLFGEAEKPSVAECELTKLDASLQCAATGDSSEGEEVVDANLLVDELIRGLRRLSDALGLNEAYWIRIAKPEARIELETVEEVAMQALLALQWSITRGRLEPEAAKGFINARRALVGTQHDEVSVVFTLDRYAEGDILESDALPSLLVLMAKLDLRPLSDPGNLAKQGEAGFDDETIARKCLAEWVVGRGGPKDRGNNEELFGCMMRHLGHTPAATAVRSLRRKVPLKTRGGKQTQNAS